MYSASFSELIGGLAGHGQGYFLVLDIIVALPVSMMSIMMSSYRMDTKKFLLCY